MHPLGGFLNGLQAVEEGVLTPADVAYTQKEAHPPVNAAHSPGE